MLVRLVLTLLTLAALLWHLEREQRAGRFERIDQQFMDFLVSTAQGRFDKTENQGEVALVEFREANREEFTSWPPPPLDWQMLLKELHVYEPDVLVITTPLFWGQPTPDFTLAVADALLKFPSVVLGVETQLVEGKSPSSVFLGDLENAIPQFQKISGDGVEVPRLAALITAPDVNLRASSEMGLLAMHQQGTEWGLPYVLDDGARHLPTLLSQALARYSRTPYAGGIHRLELGKSSGAFLQGGIYVPLTSSGEFFPNRDKAIFTVNALDLMAGTLADALGEQDKMALKKARILVVGTTAKDTPERPPSITRLYAQALSHLLAQPRINVWSQIQQWILWGVISLVVTGMVVTVRRRYALVAGVSLIVLLFCINLLLFKSELNWWPPVIPYSLVVAGTLLGLIIGRGKAKVAPPIQPIENPGVNNEKGEASPIVAENPERSAEKPSIEITPSIEKEEKTAVLEAVKAEDLKDKKEISQVAKEHISTENPSPNQELAKPSELIEEKPVPASTPEASPQETKVMTTKFETPPLKKTDGISKKSRGTRGGRGAKTEE